MSDKIDGSTTDRRRIDDGSTTDGGQLKSPTHFWVGLHLWSGVVDLLWV